LGLGADVSGARVAAARAREAAARMTLGGAAAPAPASRRGLWLLLGLLGAAMVGGGAGWIYLASQRGASRSLSTEEAAAAQARVRELEARIAQLEREKAEAETRAAEEARTTLEAQAAARGRTADPAAIERAQQEARQRVRVEQEGRQQEELRRLAEERTAEVQRLAATPLPVAVLTSVATPVPTPLPAATPTPEPTATPTPVPAPTPTPAIPAAGAAPSDQPTAAVPAGGAPTPTPTPGRVIADPNDPAVKLPSLQSEDPVPYPLAAIRMRISTSVTVRALVDERGRVAEAAILHPSGQPAAYGFDEAALKRVRGRRYRPARRQGVPVAIWVIVRFEFRPPPP
jgi:TonB family protein